LILEGNETVDVTLSTTNNILTSVSSTIGTVTIDDDADDAVVISLNNIIINESDGEVYFTVSLTGSIQYDLSFEFNTVNGSAEDFTDYLGANGTLIIPAGSSSGYTQTISVMILEDSIPEATETFSVNLSNIQSSGSSSFLNNNGIATIIDSDAIVLSDEANVGEDISINIDVLNNDTFASDDLIEITGVTAPANGNVIINPDNTTTYTPNPDFNGEDSYEYTVTITNTDGSSTSATAAVTINVSAVNDNVVDSVTTDEEVPVIIPVLDNDGFDPSSNPVITDVTDPANGTVVINEDGTVTYTPDPDFNGEDTFEYTVSVPNSDGSVTTETGTVIIVVIGVGDVVNDFEVAIDHDPIEIDVLANDTFTTNTVVIVSEVTNPENGSAVINANGTVAYEANESFYGEDTFNYTVTVTNADGTTSTEEGSVIIAVHLTPFAIDDEILTEANIPIEINVLENDYDEDGTIDPSTVEIITNPLNGSVVINSDGTITFSPNLDYIGDDEFVYQVCDNNGLCDTAVVKVIVAGVLAADLIIPQAFSPNGDGTHDVFVINNLSNLYPNFQLQIYNRYGNIVYDYRHNGNPLTKPIWWDGFSNGRMTINRKDQVPVGTYFYTLHFNKDNAKPISGYVYLNR
jgi:gliding motility-associated-like protein